MGLFDKLKDKKKIGDNERDAKMGVMKAISDMAGSAMGDKLKGIKKVSVASDSKEGLAQGLDKAKNMLSDVDDRASEAEESPEHEMAESKEDEDAEHLAGLDKDGEAGQDEVDNDGHILGDEDEESPEHEAMESPEEEDSEHDGLSHEELDAKLEKLMKAKKKLESKY